MFTPRAHRPFVFWSRFLAGAVILFPYSLTKIDFRSVFTGGVSVSANRSSPPYSAFEDLRENFDSELPTIPDNGERLASGQTVDMKVVQQIPRQRHLMMAGMTLRSPAPARVEPEAFYVAGENVRKMPAMPLGRALVEPKAVAIDESLPLPERKAALVAQLNTEDWALPGPARLARELTEQELLRQGREIPDEKPIIDEERYTANIASLTPNPDYFRPLWLNGQIEMSGGLAFVGPENHMVVKRVLNGNVQEQGRIWVTEGRFEIHVKKATGYLVAELQSRDGRILGRGEMNLMHLTNVPRKGDRVSDIRLSLHPTTEGASVRTASGYSHGAQRIHVADARVEIQAYTNPQKVDDEGFVSEPSLNRDSSFVARGSAKRHWSSLVVGQAHRTQDLRLFSNSLVDALINLDLEGMDRREAQKMAVVWGQITEQGKPLAGAAVEMAGNYKAIYFNDMYLPDKKMLRTGSNGMFAFLKVKQGVQALRVKANGRMYPAQIFPSEEKHVSFVDVEVRNKVVSQFRVFDVLDLERPISARIRLVGTDEILPVGQQQYVEYSVAADPFMIEAEAGSDYEVSRMTFTGAPHLVNVPLLRRQWMYELYETGKVRTLPGRGSIVGFIDDQDFEVELTGYSPQEQMQILYFDAQGKPLETRTGIAGGGFIIFNAPAGLQTIYIHPTQSRETYSQVVVAEPQYVHVVAWAAASKRR